MSRLLMAGVFILSAAIGGGVAGLYLAMNATGSDEPSAVAGTLGAPSPAGAARKRVRLANGSSALSATAPSSRKEQDRIRPEPVRAVAVPRPARGRREAGAGAKVAVPGGGAGSAEPSTTDLKKLTEQVVAALGAIDASAATPQADAEAGAERLRRSLADLVNAALAQGKSDEQIRRLVQEALESAGEGAVPAILRDASGKLDIRRLLASVMPSFDRMLPQDGATRSYVDQLQAEAGDTTLAPVAEPTAAPEGRSQRKERKSRGRFFFRNGKRYTIVRRGDTLSDIAYAAYGDVLAYPAILRANRGRVSVNRLKPGTRLLVPDIPGRKRRVRRRARRQGGFLPEGNALGERRLATDAARRQDKVSADSTDMVAPVAAGIKPVKVTNFTSARKSVPVALPGVNAPPGQ